MENNIDKYENFNTNLAMVCNRLRSGLSIEELEEIKNTQISPQWRVKDLIEANLRVGYIKFEEGKFTTTTAKISIRLSEEEEEILKEKAIKEGISPLELAEKYVIKGLYSN